MIIPSRFADVELVADTVTLRSLMSHHSEELLALAALNNMSSLWFTQIPSSETIDDYIATAMAQKHDGSALPFVVVENKTGKLLGMTRLCNADFSHRRFEIGYTWYGADYQRTSVNTECKLLLLAYAFEQLKAIAIEFRTHWHNHKSRAAIARLGAKQDGILRNHKIHPDGELRDTVVFSIIASEWPVVKKSLRYKQQQYC